MRDNIVATLKNGNLVDFAPGSEDVFEHRLEMHRAVQEVTYVKPSKENLDHIITQLRNVGSNKILDVGCGSGYWSKLINDNGFDVTGIRQDQYGVDNLTLYDNIKNVEFSSLSDEELNQYDTILLFWPNYDNPFGYQVFKKYLELDNIKNLIYIGEVFGCTGDDDLSDILVDDELMKEKNINSYEVMLDTFMGFHDYMMVFNKKDKS